MNTFCINGKFIKESEAKISVFDLGLTRAYGVFDFLRTYNRVPFYLDEHLKRLLRSAKIIGLRHNYDLPTLKKLVLKTLKLNKHLKEANIRIYLTGGEARDFLTPNKANLIIIITPLKNLDERIYQEGGKLITKISERIIPLAKTTVYTEGINFLQEAKRKGAIEVLLIDKEGKILECVTSNFFAVIDGKLLTPPKGRILEGITKMIVIKLAKKLKIPFIEREIYYHEIEKFTEAFITATNKEIVPIIKIDKQNINEKKVGMITKTLLSEFRRLTKITSSSYLKSQSKF